MSKATFSDRVEPGAYEASYHFATPGHPIYWAPGPGQRQKRRAFMERPESSSTELYRGAYVRPSRYYLARVSRKSGMADFWLHGKNGNPFCVKTVGYQSVQDSFGGGDLMMRGWNQSSKMPEVPTRLVNKADSKCLDGVQINLAENLATYKESLRSVSSLVVTGLEYLDGVRKLSLKNGSKTLADLWLTYQYGVKPLISDILHAQDFVFRQPGFVLSRGQASELWSQSALILNNSLWMVTASDERTRWGCNTQVAYTVDSPFLAGVNSLGFANPALLLWELIPFSFVVDWFINVGEVVSTMNQGAGLSFLFGSRTRWLKPNYHVEWRPALDPNREFLGTPFSETCQGGIFYHREVLDNFPTPSLIWRPNLDTTKLLNAIALFKGR